MTNQKPDPKQKIRVQVAEYQETWIDDQAEKFESQWRFETSGPCGILRFLASEALGNHAENPLAVVLIQIDIERSWMAWSKYVDTVGMDTDPIQLKVQLSRIALLREYATVFLSSDEFNSSLKELVDCEFVSRSQWGDSIGAHHYNNLFNTEIRKSILKESRQVHCKFKNGNKDRDVIFPLNGLNQFGRQRSTDVRSLFLEQLPIGNRIVMADRSEAEVSRNHLEVQLLTHNHAIATNLSTINPVLLTDATKIQTAESRLLSFPFSVRLPGRILVFT